jgi:hypothetical protein
VEGIKHFPPVVLTYQWCPYSMKQPLECTWGLMLLTLPLKL